MLCSCCCFVCLREVPKPAIKKSFFDYTMRSSTPLCFLAVCLLGPALAFVSPSGGIVASHARRSAPSSCTSRTRTISPLVMQAGGPTAEAAVERYKKYVGPARWSSEEGMAEKAAGVFEEISSVYGEENAAEMVRAPPACLVHA